jgi:excisionase family DNA binding protein
VDNSFGNQPNSEGSTMALHHDNPYLSLDDAAELAGVSVKTLRRRIAEGRVVGYRMGPRCIRVRLLDLEASAHRIPSARAFD